MSDFLDTIVGGAVAILASVWATRKAHAHNLDMEEMRRLGQIDSTISALNDEIIINWRHYEQRLSPWVKKAKDDSGLLAYISAPEDCFQVFNSHTSVIGSIDDEDLRRAILEFYCLAKMQLVQFKVNNHYVAESDKFEERQRLENGKPIPPSSSDHPYHIQLTHSLATIKGLDADMRKLYESLTIQIPAYRNRLSARIKILNSK